MSDAEVIDADPLGLDEFYAAMPLAQRTPSEVFDVFRAAVATARELLPPSPPVALAILRDLDPLLCATQVHRPGTWLSVLDLEWVLRTCGRIADHIPRGDNATYGRYNPPAPRTRTFTHTPEEHALYRGLAMGESGLDRLLAGLSACLKSPVGSEIHAFTAESLAHWWEPMIDGAKLMRKAHVAPVMGGQIAPWVSHTFVIGGRPYRGPTAAQLPVVLVDELVWGADCDDPTYREYHRFYAAEQPTPRRRRARRALEESGGRTLLVQLAKELPRVGHSAQVRRSLDGVGALLRRMHGFRASHLAFARPSLPIRPGGEESWGSGEFDPEMLDRLLAHTIAARARLFELEQQLQPA